MRLVTVQQISWTWTMIPAGFTHEDTAKVKKKTECRPLKTFRMWGKMRIPIPKSHSYHRPSAHARNYGKMHGSHPNFEKLTIDFMLGRHYKCAFYTVICGIFITSLLSDLSLRVVTYDRTVVFVVLVLVGWLFRRLFRWLFLDFFLCCLFVCFFDCFFWYLCLFLCLFLCLISFLLLFVVGCGFVVVGCCLLVVCCVLFVAFVCLLLLLLLLLLLRLLMLLVLLLLLLVLLLLLLLLVLLVLFCCYCRVCPFHRRCPCSCGPPGSSIVKSDSQTETDSRK